MLIIGNKTFPFIFVQRGPASLNGKFSCKLFTIPTENTPNIIFKVKYFLVKILFLSVKKLDSDFDVFRDKVDRRLFKYYFKSL